jgi:hypothetical protein
MVVDNFVINHASKVLKTVELDICVVVVDIMWVIAGAASA